MGSIRVFWTSGRSRRWAAWQTTGRPVCWDSCPASLAPFRISAAVVSPHRWVDVYKRQVLVLHFGAHRGRPIVSGFGDDQEDRNLPGEAVHAHAPVSYTHLDVYKRQ